MRGGWIGTRVLKFSRSLLCAALMSALNGCNQEQLWKLPKITGHLPDLRFSLLSDTGQAVTAQTYQGYLVLLFFGFTRCRAECPATLFRLASIAKQLKDNAGRVRILLVSLDFEHDTPQVLHRYVSAFDAGQVIGLTGGKEAIEDLAKRCRAAYRPDESDSGGFTHSAAVYVFDPQGHARLLITPNDTMAAVAGDLQRLLDPSR